MSSPQDRLTRTRCSLPLGVPKDELAVVHTHQLRSLGGMPVALGGIAFLCLLAYLMFVGCAPVAHSKVIGVERLLGWGRLAIWLQLITPALAAQLAAAILCDVAILALVAPLSFEFLALLVALQVVPERPGGAYRPRRRLVDTRDGGHRTGVLAEAACGDRGCREACHRRGRAHMDGRHVGNL